MNTIDYLDIYKYYMPDAMSTITFVRTPGVLMEVLARVH